MIRVLGVALLILGCREAQGEVEAARPDVPAPCDGCLVELPSGRGPFPLLVVLHGDEERARKWFDRWRGPALERGYGILALECPAKLGCPDGSWYRWNGDPAWIAEQVDAVASHIGIDRSRAILVGWSGGATYLGMHAERWHRDFAAIVFHGGGIAPPSRKCAPRALPTYFLVGARNWFHSATRELRTYAAGCGSDIMWDVVDGADHQAEDQLLDARRANQILAWMSERVRPHVSG